MPDYDVVILGGGPGGLSALLWCHSLNLQGVVLERAPELGGQLLQMHHRILDYPGVVAADGRDLRDHFVGHVRELGLEWRAGCGIDGVDLDGRGVRCDGGTVGGRALVLATGARKRRLGVPGEDEFEGRGVSFSATRDHQAFAGRAVCVVGGGDSAFENCLILARVCPQVTLLHRSDRFRARPEWVAAVRSHPGIIIRAGVEVAAIHGGEWVTGVAVSDRRTGAQEEIPAQGVFVRIGVAPSTEMFRGQVALDDEGYITTDRRQRTSRPMVYAAGDVCRPVCLSVAVAAGHGAVAVKDIANQLRQGRG
ncbi:MAG TPA: NAD(P)/FAD-dependent oxidoreductase [Blastocatellia bacterium]|nr:NAD(P)/FAD-dependent oxidoreductase [Blastocatellia bacterium]